ncbi:MAG TPA: FtsW/RodA/SpoVE family cell cycle protein [Bacillales bacterium]|nr:FtsW/RodA/SpoVE family cell cycle protein [Bacillales bacterium]
MVKKMFRHFDYKIIVPVLLLCGFGLLMVYSSSMIVALNAKPKPLPADYFFVHQSMNMAASIVAFFLAMLFPYKAYEKLMKPILAISLASLVAVLFVGHVSNNAQSWIEIAGFNFQPSEFVKIGLIIYLAGVFSKKQHYISNFSKGVVPPLIVILITFMLIAAQPDLGTAMIVIGIAGVMIVCSGMRMKHLFGLLSLAGIGTSLLLLFGSFISSEQASRFAAAYSPFENPDNGGWQLINSYIAIATGGFNGQGLGQGIQKFGFLPESYTDFIMSIIAEEFGFIGVFLVIGCLGYLVFKGFMTGIKCKDTFGSLLAIGISGMLGVQSIINLGVVCGLVPVTGVPLPFISYGGSALVLFMFSMGVLVNISMFVNLNREKGKEERMDVPQPVYEPYMKRTTLK